MMPTHAGNHHDNDNPLISPQSAARLNAAISVRTLSSLSSLLLTLHQLINPAFIMTTVTITAREMMMTMMAKPSHPNPNPSFMMVSFNTCIDNTNQWHQAQPPLSIANPNINPCDNATHDHRCHLAPPANRQSPMPIKLKITEWVWS